MPRNIDIGLLRTFIAVSETGGMTSGSRILNLTQAAVSQQIKRLEELFEAELFDRSQRQLTPAGERLMGNAHRIIAMNDEIWGLMTSPDFEGEVRLGVPHDIVGPFMPPILRSFSYTWPRVRVTLVCETTPRLLGLLKDGKIDLTLTTEAEPGDMHEFLLTDPLVWVGARDGNAHTRDPLPISLGNETCAFRAAALKALTKAGRNWSLICQVSDMGPLAATLEADLAIAPFLAQTVPDNVIVLDKALGLPPLPSYHINLRLPPASVSEIAAELADHIRKGFLARYTQAA
ncbi:HTH-type transcriptional regulator YofA [bacterium MnTg02]|nr:HTH-type transcriptional regulator YofA [bacterium MnTg02]